MGNLSDFSALIELQKLIGKELHELFPNEKAHQSKGSEHRVKVGYVVKGNRITSLVLNTYPYISDKEFIKLPESIGDLELLEDLKLINCRELENINNSIGKLNSLNILDCTGCRSLKALPDDIGQLNNLEQLNLIECYSIKQLPYTLTNLKKLRILNLKDCQSLTSLPDNLGDLKTLEVLNLEHCRSLKNLPESITNLPNLKILRLTSCNSIEYLPKEIGNLNKLKDIGLVGCARLSSIPKSFSKLNSIDLLNLSYCYSLTKLPDVIGSMQNLNSIILKGCRELEFLPNNIGNLKSLKELDLYACRKLKELPDSMVELVNLMRLDLSFCDNLSRIPNEITELSNVNLKVIKFPKKTKEDLIPENIYNLQPRSYDNELSPYRIRNYQERIQLFSHDVSDRVNYYMNLGICPPDAKIMADFSLILKRDLIQTNIFTNLDENQDDMHWMFHFKINSDNRVVELHIHQLETIFLTLFPEILCSLDQLEVIRFPNNCIEIIPECITKLKFLKVLDVSNFEAPNPFISDSIKSYVKGLENFNEFYK